MKNIALISLTAVTLSFSTPSFAGSTNAESVSVAQPTNTIQLIDKFADKIGDKADQYIKVLASKLGVAADHFYPVFVRQQMITGIFELSLMALGFGLGSWCMGKGFKHLPASNTPSDREDTIEERAERETAGVKMVISFIAGALLLIITAISLMAEGPTAVTATFNPEYAAFQSIIQMIK